MTVRTLEDGAQRSLEDGTARLLESGGSTFDPLLDRALPFDGQKVYLTDWRAMVAPELLDGPLRGEAGELAVSASAVAFAVDVATGSAVIGGLHVENDTVRTLACAPAEPIPTNDLSPTLLDRIDLAVAGLDLASRVAYVDLKTGTAAVSPVAPAPTDDSFHLEIPLAEVLVAAGTTELADDDITDRRRWAVPPHGAAGLVGWLSVTYDAGTATSALTEQVLDGWSLDVLLHAGRRYRVWFGGWLINGGAADNIIRVRDGDVTGPVLATGYTTGVALGSTIRRTGVFEPTEGWHTLVVTSELASGSSSRQIAGSDTAAVADAAAHRPWLLVADLGPVGS